MSHLPRRRPTGQPSHVYTNVENSQSNPQQAQPSDPSTKQAWVSSTEPSPSTVVPDQTYDLPLEERRAKKSTQVLSKWQVDTLTPSLMIGLYLSGRSHDPQASRSTNVDCLSFGYCCLTPDILPPAEWYTSVAFLCTTGVCHYNLKLNRRSLVGMLVNFPFDRIHTNLLEHPQRPLLVHRCHRQALWNALKCFQCSCSLIESSPFAMCYSSHLMDNICYQNPSSRCLDRGCEGESHSDRDLGTYLQRI